MPGTCHIAYTTCDNLMYLKPSFCSCRCDTESPTSFWRGSWRPEEIPHNAYNHLQDTHFYMFFTYHVKSVSSEVKRSCVPRARIDEHLGRSVRESEAGRMWKLLAGILPRQWGGKTLSFAKGAEIFKDHKSWRISFSLHFTWKYTCPGSSQTHKVVCHFSSDEESLFITLIDTKVSSSIIPGQTDFTQSKACHRTVAGKHVPFTRW